VCGRWLIKALLIAILVLLGLSLALGAPGCMFAGPEDDVTSCGTPVTPVSLSMRTQVLGVAVTPSSGTGAFEMTVTYEWQYDGPGSIPKASPITCFYSGPDGESVRIGDIDPTADPSGYILEKAGWIRREKTFTFDVRPRYGPPASGTYLAQARVEGRAQDARTAAFQVIADPAAGTTTTEQVTSTTATSLPQTTTTVFQYSVYRLELSVMSPTLGFAGHHHIDWAGEISIGPDGLLSGELSGIADMHGKSYDSDGAPAGTVGFNVNFTARVSGNAETTEGARSLHIKQTLSSFEWTIEVVDGKPDTNFVPGTDATVKGWVTDALVDLVLPAGSAPYTGPVTGWSLQGTATLTPVR
jgi:hypothetical protein